MSRRANANTVEKGLNQTGWSQDPTQDKSKTNQRNRRKLVNTKTYTNALFKQALGKLILL